MDLWVTGGGEAVLQVQHREDLGVGWGAERAVQLQSGQAVWMEPGSKGRYRVAVGGQRWWGWHMTWLADHGEGVSVRKEWGGELPGGGTSTGTVRAHFTRATFVAAPTPQGHRGQVVVYTFQEEMKLQAAQAIQMTPDEGAARMANRTLHVHPHTGDTPHYAFPGEDSMEVTSPLPECVRQGNDVSALGRRMGARGGTSGSAERDRDGEDSGGNPAEKVLQGGMDDTGGHKVHIPHGTEGAGGGAVERASSPRPPP